MTKKRTHKDALLDIFYTAYKFDDKPHQLFTAILHAAKEHARKEDLPEIERLMLLAYENAHKLLERGRSFAIEYQTRKGGPFKRQLMTYSDRESAVTQADWIDGAVKTRVVEVTP